MLKKILTAVVFGLFAMQLNICAAMIAPYQMTLGGITYGTKIDELKKIHGEPDAIYKGIENYSSCTYGDGVIVHYNENSGQIIGIDVTEKSWAADGGICVGMYYDEWLKNHAEPDEVKKGDVQTVYGYFHYKSDPVEHVTYRDAGLFIAFDNKSGTITEMKIYGDTDFATFDESFESIMSDMLVPIAK